MPTVNVTPFLIFARPFLGSALTSGLSVSGSVTAAVTVTASESVIDWLNETEWVELNSEVDTQLELTGSVGFP